MTNMDELLKLLQKNARETPAHLAKLLDRSEADVRAQMTAYEQNGVIRGYQAIINTEQLDLELVHAVIEIKISPEREGGFNRMADRLSKFPEVISLYLMSGTYDLLAFVAGRNLKEVAMFVSEKLATIEGILSTSTHFMLKTYKEHGVMMEEREKHERLKITP